MISLWALKDSLLNSKVLAQEKAKHFLEISQAFEC